MFSGAVGASTGVAAVGIGGFLDDVAINGSKLANFALGVGSKGVTSGVMDTLGDPDLLSGQKTFSFSDLATNIGFDLAGQGVGDTLGIAGNFASRELWSENQRSIWDASMSLAWKYLETPARYVLSAISQ